MKDRAVCACAILAAALACAPSDAGVTAMVKSKLAGDDFVRGRNINVDTKDHVVKLTGEVRTEQEKTIAIDIAKRTAGVSNVIDNLTVASELRPAPTTGTLGEPAASAERVEGDRAIASEVKGRLRGDPMLRTLDIDVDTIAGVVTLKGDVPTQAEHDRAVDIVRQSDGVMRVDDRLKVKRQTR